MEASLPFLSPELCDWLVFPFLSPLPNGSHCGSSDGSTTEAEEETEEKGMFLGFFVFDSSTSVYVFVSVFLDYSKTEGLFCFRFCILRQCKPRLNMHNLSSIEFHRMLKLSPLKKQNVSYCSCDCSIFHLLLR